MKRIKLLLIILSALIAVSGCFNAQNQDVKSVQVSPEPTHKTEEPVKTDEPAVLPEPSNGGESSPEPKGDGYLTGDDTEEIIVDEENGYWLYRSSAAYVEVKRIFDEKKVITYFVADVRIAPGETEIAGFGSPKRPGHTKVLLFEICRMYKSVVAINGDYMARVDTDRKGIIIRDGKKYSEKKAEDTIAFFPDGTLRLFKPGETTANKLLAQGVKNTYSFGPTLVSGHKINQKLRRHRLYRKNPRSAVGYVEPYHYILVLADGRRKGYSTGMTLDELAQVFTDYNCELAYNLDGGASATISFMGENISRYNNSTTGQRAVPDALMFGYSSQVPK